MRYLPLILIPFLFSCDNASSKTNNYSAAELERIEQIKDSLQADIDKNMNSSLFDTANLATAPVKVLKASLIKKEYSNYKDISLTYKNISDKKISAIRFKWYGETAFGDPADMGSYMTEGFGGGFDDDALRAGKTKTGQWNILSRNAKKVIKAWPYEVVFEDGTKWLATNK